MTDSRDERQRNERQQRVERLNWHCQREAKITGLPADHQIVVVRAGLALYYERMLDEVIDTGRAKEPNAFVKLSELQLAHAPKAPPPVIHISFTDEGGPAKAPASEITPTADATPPDSSNDTASAEDDV